MPRNTNIFFCCGNQYRKIRAELQALSAVESGSDGKLEELEKWERLLDAVMTYIRDGDWCDKEWVRQRLSTLAESGYKAACEAFGVHRSSLVNLAGRYQDLFLRHIGRDFPVFMASNNYADACKTFIFTSGCKGFVLFDKSLRERLPNMEDVPEVSIDDTEQELRFLHSVCGRRIWERLRDSDEAKLIRRYLKFISCHGSSRSLKDKVRLLGLIEERLGQYKLGELNLNILQDFLNEYAKKPYMCNGRERFYSQSALNKMYDNLNCCIKYARQNGLIKDNPMEHIRKPETKHFSEDAAKDLSDEDIRLILSSLRTKPLLWTLVLTMLHTGIRPEEAFALKYSDFDFNAKTVSIKRALSIDYNIDIDQKRTVSSRPLIKELKNERKGKKNAVARRTLAVDDTVLDAVCELWRSIHSNQNLVGKRAAAGYEEFLFTAPTDGEIKRPDYYLQEYGKELRRHGVDSKTYRMYRFRHNFCTRLIRDHKLDIKTVAAMMGDSSIDMVMRVYQSVHNEDTLDASTRFTKCMSKVMDNLAD